MTISTDCWETTRVIQDSLHPDVRLLYAQFDNEEFIQLESDNERIGSLQWSGAVAVADCVRIASETLGDHALATGGTESYVRKIREANILDLDVAQAQEIALSDGDNIDFLTLCYNQCAISWLPSKLKLKTDIIPHIEISYSSETVNLPKLVDFIGKTATPNVVRALQQSIQPIDQFFKQ